ncbi:MAG: HPr family phosphocarrier protein [Lachnospiraceae bacterium]|nr:HPr family phosphocarrier protein [Lachnospiraceae bacterium]
MISFNYVITDEVGIHARPAGALVKAAKAYGSKIVLENLSNGKSADAKKLMLLMSLGVKKGDEVKVTVEGDDEAVAAEELEKFFGENL